VRRLFNHLALLCLSAAPVLAQNAYSITSISPGVVTAGSAATGVTIMGTLPTHGHLYFNLAPTFVNVDLGGSVTVANGTEIVFTVPAAEMATAGTATITATDDSGGVSNAEPFYIVNAPTISSFSPTDVGVGSNDLTLTVNGTNFVNGVSTVIWDPNGSNTSLTTTFVSATQLTAVVPAALMTSVGGIAVQVSDGNGITASAVFAIKTPQIANTSPTNAPAGADVLVTINGNDFVNNSTAYICSSGCGNQSNYAALSTNYVSSTQLTATIPAATLTSIYPGAAQLEVSNVPGSTTASVISNNRNFQVTAPIPTVTILSPASALALSTTFTLTVTGTNFISGTSQVLWCNACGTTYTTLATTFVNSTTLTATVPANLLTSVGSATVLVTNGGTAVSTANQTFLIAIPTPAVTLISPTGVVQGTGTTTLSVSGSNFLSGGNSTVTWCLSGCGSATNLTTTYVSSTLLTATIPSSLLTAVGTAAIGVTNSSGGVSVNSSSTIAFSITTSTAPTVTAVSPSSATAGTPNSVTITLTGTNYTSGAGGSVVTWCNFCSGSPTTLGTTYVSATSLTAVIPASLLTTAGSAQIGVANGSTSSAINQTFTINPKPSISTISPTTAVAGQGALSLTISGTNFPTTSTIVLWTGPTGSAQLTPNSGNTSTSLVVSIPASLLTTAGTGNVAVSDTVNQVPSATASLTINPPAVTSISPTSATAGTANSVTLTVNGTGFLPSNVSVVTWCNACGGSAPNTLTTTYVSATQLMAVVPSGLLTTAGTVQVGVTNGTGAGPSTQTFTISPKPVLSSLTPSTATAGQGSLSLTLTGTSFPASPIVNWTAGSTTTPLTVSQSSSVSITVTVPASLLVSAGSATVLVTDAVSQVPSNTLTFTIAASGVTSISPTHAVAGTTNAVTLTVSGSNFVSGSSTVTWCNSCGSSPTSLTTTFVSATQLTANVPASLLATAGSAQVGVTTGSVPAPGTQTFTIAPIPVLSSLSQTSASQGQASFTLTLTGTNFPVVSTIVNWTFNGVATPLSITANSSTSITATVAASLLTVAGTATVDVTDSISLVSSNNLNFTVAAPTVTSVSPGSATAGTSTPVTITVTGTNFVSASTVTWCNACGTSPVQLTTTYVGGTQLTATIPVNLLAAAATVQVGVINTATSLPTSTQNFVVGSGPLLTNLSPSTAVALQPNAVSLNLTGTNLPTANTRVNWTFNGVTTTLSTTSDTATLIVATVPTTLLTVAGTATVSVTNTAIGVTSNTVNFVVNPAPNISTLSPSFAFINPVNDLTLTLSGTNFPTVSPVVNWTFASRTTQLAVSGGNSASSIVVTVPHGLLNTVGTATVSVTDPVSGATSNSASFTLTSNPQITTLSPTSVPVGSATFTLMLTGSAFLTSDVLVWTPSGGAPITISNPTVGNSGSSISFNVPSTDVVTPGPVSMQIQDTANNVSSNLVNTFTINSPALTSISPTAVPAGMGQTTLTVNGSNFVSSSVVTYCASSTSCTPTALTTTFVSSSQLTATLPANLLTTPANGIQIGVQTVILSGNITATNPQGFTVTGPAITSISPTSVSAGSGVTTLSVFGSNFVASSIVTLCNSCGSSPTLLTTTFVSATQLTATVTADLTTSAATYSVGVQSGTVVATNPQTFTVGGPSITSIAPSGTTAGVNANVTVTVNGANFVSGTSAVTWCNLCNGAPTTLVTTFVSSTLLTAVIPTNLLTIPGSAQIGVNNGVIASSTTQTFTIGTIGLTTVTPTSAAAGSPGVSITLTGSNFTSTSSVVFTLGSTVTTVTPTSITATQITALLPSTLLTTAGSATIAVQVGSSVSSTVGFTINNPTITSITPPKSATGVGAFSIAVAGTNFLSGSVVQWTAGGSTTPLSTSFTDANDLVAIVGSAQVATAGTALISVMNTGGAVSPGVVFQVGAAPAVTTLTPTTTTAGSGATQIALQGTNFQNGSIVTWNNSGTITNLATGYVDVSDLTATIPASLLTAPGTALVAVQNPGSVNSNSLVFTVTPGSTPTITPPLTPSSEAAGGPAFQLIVTGSNFVSGSVIQWNSGTNTTALTTSYSTGQLSALVPASLIATAGTAFVSVLNPGGGTSTAVPFTISTNQPTISSPNGLSPATAQVGSAALTITVTGTNFVNGSTMQWNAGSSAQSIPTVFNSATSLTAIVPATDFATAGTVLVSVSNPGGAVSNTAVFSVTPASAPSINTTGGLAPSSAAVGSPAFLISIAGSNFFSGSTVQWSAAGGTPTTLTTSFLSSTQLTALVPASLVSAAGFAFINVINPGNVSSNSVSFSIGAAPGPTISTANGLIPSSAAAGGPAMQLIVVGTNFVSGSVVNWNSGTNQALTTSFVSSTQLAAVLPAALIATSGVAFVSVQNPGPVNSNSVAFTIGASTTEPTISSSGGLTPSTALAGSASFQLTVTGSNFQNGSVVQWNANGTATPLATGFSSSTTLNALVPATLVTTPGISFVSVLNPDKSTSNSVTFTISGSVPNVTTLTPASAAAGSQTLQLTITGTGFATTSVAQWNGTAIPTNFVSQTQLNATVSSSLLSVVGTAFVTVVNPGGNITSGATFTVAGPTLTTISPSSAVSGGASLTLTLTGTNFVIGSVASWNGTVLPTTIASATSATAQLSSNLLATAGTFAVIVTNPGGSVTAAQFFTLSAPAAPIITGVTPTSAIAGGPAFQLTVAGTGFVSGAVLQWNGTSVATTFVSATQLSALISNTLIATAGTANITVQIPGAPLSASSQFPINPPSITTMSPTTVAAGGPAFQLTVTGGNFIPGSTVQWNGTSLPTIYNSATQLTADVAANLIASGGTASITVQNGGTANSAPATFTIGPFTLAITSTSLPDAVVGTSYSQLLSATGGSPPYTWTVSAGTLPSGITLDAPSGSLSGTATAAVVGTVGFTVTDSVARTTTKSIAFRSVAPLTISTVTPLTSAPAGVPFSQILAATGGTAPYTWSLTGSLPTGLALNTSTGQISGTPTVPGVYNFTINIADTRSQISSVPFSQTVTVAGVTIGGITTTSTSGQQLPLNVTIANPYSVNVTGTLTLVFTSAVGASDPAIQFGTGGLIANFTIPAGTTQAVFGTQQSVLLITGTTAGSIAVTAALQAGGASVTPTTAPSITTVIAKSQPVITALALTTSGTNLVVTVTGYSNTRDMTTGNFQFLAAPGSTLTAAPIAVNLASTFSAWYQSSASLNFGSQFTFSVPISFTGSINAIGSVSVTLVNSAGTSAAVTATRQ
jgi:hypothetical protein